MGTWKKLAYQDDVITKALLTEQGDIIYASAASTPAALAHGAATQYLKSGGHGANPSWDTPAGGGPTIVLKTADQSVTSSTVLVNDTHLKFAVLAYEVWEFMLALIPYSASTTPEMDIAFAIPAGASIRQRGSLGVVASEADGTAETLLNLPAASNVFFIAFYLYIGGASGGDVQLKWAQNVSNATATTMKTNSYIIAHKLG